MHKKLTIGLLVLCLALGTAASMPESSMAQGTRKAAAAQQTKRRVVSSARSAAPTQDAQQRRDLLLGKGSFIDSLQGIFTGAQLDPMQLGIGAALALIIRSILVRAWHMFLGILRFLFARRRRVMTPTPAPQVQYIAVQPQPAPAPQAPVMAAAPAVA